MAIITLQKRMTEVGRIRMGEKVAIPDQPGKAPGRSRPAKLANFRLTSFQRGYVESAAEVYGGTVQPWETERGRQWQVYIESNALDVVVAPAEAFSQWYEMWTGGGCARRCNGMLMETRDGKDVRDDGIDCMCPEDQGERLELAKRGMACKPTTRLSVWLPRLTGLGVWRAETHGFYAASELPASVSFLQGLYAQGFRPIASLRMTTREIRKPGEPTKQFPVLELDLPDVTLAGLMSEGMALPGEAQPILGAGGVAALGPGAAPKQIGAPRAEAEWSAPAAAAPQTPAAVPAPAARPTGTPPAPRERRERPGAGTRAELPAQSDMRKPAPAVAATTPAPGHAPEPFEEMLPFAQDDDDPGPAPVATAAPAPAAAAPAPVVSPLRAPANPDAIPVVPGQTGAFDEPAVVVTADGEVLASDEEALGLTVDDEGMTAEAFKGMIGLIGAPPRWVVDLAHELFPAVTDFRMLNDVQRGKLYNESAIRWENEKPK